MVGHGILKKFKKTFIRRGIDHQCVGQSSCPNAIAKMDVANMQ